MAVKIVDAAAPAALLFASSRCSPASNHGFSFPERAVYDTFAADETSTKIFAMWDRNLK